MKTLDYNEKKFEPFDHETFNEETKKSQIIKSDTKILKSDKLG